MLIMFKLLYFLQRIFSFVACDILRLPLTRERLEFEDYEDEYAQSFNDSHERAYASFHVSSEGEFAQVVYLIEHLLYNQRKIELIYTSPSLKRRIGLFKDTHSCEFLRVIRLPLIKKTTLTKWSTSDSLVMVRYDFFPTLMILGLSKKKFILYSASLKSSSSFSRIFKLAHLKCFTHLIPATKNDLKELKSVLKKDVCLPLDLRVLEINTRQRSPSAGIKQKLKAMDELLFSKFSEQTRFLFSQVWDYEEELLNKTLEKSGKEVKAGQLIYMAPHNISDENKKFFKSQLSKHKDFQLIVLEKDMSHIEIKSVLSRVNIKGSDKIILLSMIPGILCELYPYFTHCYVGGGFGKGIHSVLEPFVANSTIQVGPKVQRSTEFETIKNLGVEIKVIDSLQREVSLRPSFSHESVDVSDYIRHNEESMCAFEEVLQRNA